MEQREKESLVLQMTSKEKAEAAVMHKGRCFVVERLCINGFRINDNPRGNEDYIHEEEEQRSKSSYRPVAYPQAAALASTWNKDTVFQVGAAMGKSCKLHDMDVLLRPGVNIKRSPLCGRNFEYYSEDPVVSGELGAAFIQGVQSEGTAACLKHYAVNSQEFERMTTNAVVSERALREIYLRPFEIAIREGKPWTIMTSYNKVNGYWVPENEELMHLLREEFGFDGVVLSDAMAVQIEKIRSHRYGLDFEIGTRGSHTRELQEALDSGELDEKYVNRSILRMLELCDKVHSVPAEGKEDFEAEHKKARKIAADGIVLLENDGILPLDKEKGKAIAVIGTLAKTPNYMGGGSGHMNGYSIDRPLTEIEKNTGNSVSYAQGYNIIFYGSNENAKKNESAGNKNTGSDSELLEEALRAAREADIVIFFTGLPFGYESEGYDRTTLELPENQITALEKVLEVSENVILVNISGAAVDLKTYKGRVRAVLHSYLAGESMGGALADVIFGDSEPGGRLPETFPKRLEDTPAYLNFPHYPQVMRNVWYGEDIYVGYRWYEKRGIGVLYPFGYGLSYTSFSYSHLFVDKTEFSKTEKITVTLTIRNIGSRDGSQVIQFYIKPLNSSAERPVKELKAFQKVYLSKGQEKEIQYTFTKDAFSYYEPEQKKWIAESGTYIIQAGISSAEIVAETKVILKSDERAMLFHNLTAVEWLQKNEQLPKLLEDASDQAKEIFTVKNSMDDLIWALPAYRFTESLFDFPSITQEELSGIFDKLNYKNKGEE